MNTRLVPHILSLAVFIFAFRPLVRRVGAHANVWFLGWGFMLLHSIASALDPTPGSICNHLIQIWTVDLCGLAFLLVCANVPVRRLRPPLLVEFGVPILLQATIATLAYPWPALHIASVALFALPAAHILLRRKRHARPMRAVGIAFALFAFVAMPFAWHHAELVSKAAIALLFLCSAALYFTSAARITRGVVAAVAGLVLWAVSYPLVFLLARHAPAIHIDPALLDLPQYLVAAGIILNLLDEHLTRTERMAMHDPLTDLPNRRLFEERLISTMEDARINRTTVACLVIDVDNFKAINDSLGHTVGDELLRALAVRLSWHMSPRDILARTGGDEFTALLAGVNDEHHLRFMAGAMMSAASVPIAIEGHSIDVRISVGIALSPDDADDIDSLRRAADEAMYSAKRRGGSLLAFAGEN